MEKIEKKKTWLSALNFPSLSSNFLKNLQTVIQTWVVSCVYATNKTQNAAIIAVPCSSFITYVNLPTTAPHVATAFMQIHFLIRCHCLHCPHPHSDPCTHYSNLPSKLRLEFFFRVGSLHLLHLLCLLPSSIQTCTHHETIQIRFLYAW